MFRATGAGAGPWGGRGFAQMERKIALGKEPAWMTERKFQERRPDMCFR